MTLNESEDSLNRVSCFKLKNACLPETHILRVNKTLQELIDAFPDTGRLSNDAVSTGNAVQDANKVGEVVQNGQVVFNNYYIAKNRDNWK